MRTRSGGARTFPRIRQGRHGTLPSATPDSNTRKDSTVRNHRTYRLVQTFGSLSLAAAIGASGAALVIATARADPGVVDKNDLATQIAQTTGHKPDSVSCPDDLPATVGAKLKCALTDGGQAYGVSVTVTDVIGTRVGYDFKVGDQLK